MTELLTATDLEQWSERNDSREHLPTLVRRLILAVAAPETLRMPADEAVGLPGLDGEVTSPSGAPPFLPPGRSVWELGTGRNPQDKAQRDYRKRVDGSTRDERAGVVFVFVTSRRWPGSQDWVDRRMEDDDGWAGIRVLDAEDLAAWLALCPGVHRWLAGVPGRPRPPGEPPRRCRAVLVAAFRRGLNLDREDPDPEALASARAEAVQRCLSDGLPAVLRLAEASEHPAAVGDALASVTTDHDSGVLEHLARSSQPLHAMAAGLAAHRQREDAGWLAATAEARPAQAAALCRTAAIDEALLTLVDGLEPDRQDEFWRDMQPLGVPGDLMPTVARRLLERGRAWAAIDLLSHAGFGADLYLAIQALKAPALAATEDISRARSPEYAVGRLLDRLEEAGADDTLLADLEWFYQPLLDHSRRPMALHRELARNPARFVDLVSLMYRPDPDTGADSADEEARDNAASSRAFSAAWTVLREWRTPLPGSVDGQLPITEDMLRWVESVREMLTASGRARVLPVVLGDALSGAVADEDGTWPSEPVRDVLEILRDTDLDEHLAVARMNQRGVTTRGVYDGGAQERALADQYSAAADRVRGRWPRSGALLDGLSRSYRDDARREDRSAEGQGDR